MGIFASPNRASIMNSVPRYQRGIAAGTSTMFVLSGSTLSIGLAFLIMSNTMPLNYIESLFLGTTETMTKGNFNDNKTNNQDKILNQNHPVDFAIPLPHSTAIINKFLSSLHYIFLLSAIFMLVSIIPSCIGVGNDRNNKHKINNN